MNEIITDKYLAEIKKSNYLRYLFFKKCPRRLFEQLAIIFFFNHELVKISFSHNQELSAFMKINWWKKNLDLIASDNSHQLPPHQILQKIADFFSNNKLMLANLSKLIELAELEIEKKIFKSNQSLITEYIKPLSVLNQQLYYDILNVEFSAHSASIAEIYGILNFYQSINCYLQSGWFIYGQIETSQLTSNLADLLLIAKKELLAISQHKLHKYDKFFYIACRQILDNLLAKQAVNYGLIQLKTILI